LDLVLDIDSNIILDILRWYNVKGVRE